MMAEIGKRTHNSVKKASRPGENFALYLFIASFILFALTSSPAIGWLDSPEFVAQAASLGIAHSPGHPLPALLGRLATLIPIGDLVWRVNLMSSLCSVGAVMMLYLCGVCLLRHTCPSLYRPASHKIVLVFAALVAVSWALWSNAGRAEVYALQALLTTAALLSLLHYAQSRRPPHLLTTAFILALALANHHLLALVIFIPGAVFVVASPQRPTWKLSGLTTLIGLLGLSALAYLPVRSLTHPLVNFGAPHTMDRFFWTLSGAAFSNSVTAEHSSSFVFDLFEVLSALSSALTLPVLFLAMAGTWFGLRNRPTRSISGLLTSIFILCVTIRVILGFDANTSDHHAYLEPAIFALCLLALLGLGTLCSAALHAKRPLRSAPAIATFAVALLVPLQLWSNWESSNQSDDWVSDDVAHWEINHLPPYSLVLTAYFQTTFRQWALAVVEGTRPDITIVDRSFLSYPGMPSEAKRRYPELSEIIDSPLRPGVLSPIQLLIPLARSRPIFVQQDQNVDTALAQILTPAGAFAKLTGPLSTQSEREHWQRKDMHIRQNLSRFVEQSSHSEQHQALEALLWHDAMRLEQLCILGNQSAARLVYANAIALAPNDEMLDEIAVRCRLVP